MKNAKKRTLEACFWRKKTKCDQSLWSGDNIDFLRGLRERSFRIKDWGGWPVHSFHNIKKKEYSL